MDYKTQLQEKIQKQHSGQISYELIKEEGEAHLKRFTVRAMLGEKQIGIGIGNSKKEAEQNAAKAALKKA